MRSRSSGGSDSEVGANARQPGQCGLGQPTKGGHAPSIGEFTLRMFRLALACIADLPPTSAPLLFTNSIGLGVVARR